MSTLQLPVLNMGTNVKKSSRLARENNNVFQKIERPSREKILSDVNSRPCYLYNKKIRQEL